MPGAEAALAPYADRLSGPAHQIAADLESFCALLAKWQRVQNLVSRETLAEVWTRHIADSLQILPLLRPGDAVFLDLGSGGGFPALPLAIALKGSSAHFNLVEPNARKAAFLRAVVRALGLHATIHACRSDELDRAALGSIDVITARALAPLAQLCALMLPFFGPQTRAILHKGREHVDEMVESRASWQYDVIVNRSVTDAGGALLELSGLRLGGK